MKKPSIKVFKRRAEIVVETNNEPEVFDTSVKAMRQTRREIVKTIAGWVGELREQNRVAENIARREIYGKPL